MTTDRPDPKQQQLDQHRVSHDGTHLTTDQGVKVDHTDDSLKAGVRGPTLIEDFHFREKLTHFDHERIPERIVHARGSGAYGTFECTADLSDVTTASLFSAAGKETPVFVRFSTVVGFRGSADTIRDVRGFATKFYTDAGNWDLVGNNMPVFFIQDAIKFPDLVHSIKPEQHHQMPQASAAHDTFWDFVSLTPESTHMLLWVTSPRAVPRSYRMMEGFGVHTFRFVNAAGERTFVKFHWRPVLGTHSLVWDEAQKISGKDPDFNRRDLWEAIENGHHPEFELAVQLVPEADEHRFDYDLLDPTRLIPEEDVPLRTVGRMVLHRNPDNFFAETEQVAFHPGNVVPGIDFTNDPLLQGRLFSYLDTQLIRLGGPNFSQLPVNRPAVEVHNNQREGFGQHRIDRGRTSYSPNSLGGGCPATTSVDEGAFRHYAERVDGAKVRARSESFADHYSQATLFWNSMADWERQHIIDAFRFELGKVDAMHVRERMVGNLNEVANELAVAVAEGIGVPPPSPSRPNHGRRSAALSQEGSTAAPVTRKVAILAADGVEPATLLPVLAELVEHGVTCEVVAPHLGELRTADGGSLAVDRSSATMSSVLYDGVLVAGGADSVRGVRETGELAAWPVEAFKHAKAVAALDEGVGLLGDLPIPDIRLASSAGDGLVVDAGAVTSRSGDADPTDFAAAFLDAIPRRHFVRSLERVPA
jgi:catalase